MKSLKRVIAVILAAAAAFACAACHPKDEISATVTDKKSGISIDITTAQYLYAMTNAVMEAQNNIKEANPDDTIEDYTKYKVVEEGEDGKEEKTKYNKWIESRTEELLREYAGAMVKQKELKLKIEDSQLSSAEQMASIYWQYYGYQSIYEQNGVAFETYKKMLMSSYYENEYFLSIYDTDGTEPIDEKTVSKGFYDNYCLANTISIATSNGEDTEDAEDTENTEETVTVDEAKKTLKEYKSRIEKGESFEDIYIEHNKANASSDKEVDSSEMPVVYMSEKTGTDDEHFEDIYKMKKGALKIFTNADETEVILVQKQDISENEKEEDSYYNNYRESVLHMIKGDEFETDFHKFCESLKIEKKKAANRLKFDKIITDTEEQ